MAVRTTVITAPVLGSTTAGGGANLVLATPNGSGGAVSLRSLVSADLPSGIATKSGVQQEAYSYAADSGTANAYAVTLSPAPSIVAGSEVVFKAAHANTGASTLAVNGGGATAIRKNGNVMFLVAGDIAAGQIISAKFDGTVWQIIAPVQTNAPVPLFVQGAITNSSGTLAFPSANTAGNCIIVAVRSANGGGTTTIIDTAANAYTLLCNINCAISEWMECWIAENCVGGANTVTVSGSGSVLLLTVVEYSGASLTSALDVSTSAINASPSVTTTSPNDLLVFVGTGTTSSGLPPNESGGFTARFSSSGTYGGTPRGLGIWDSPAINAGTYSDGIGGSPIYSNELNILVAIKSAPLVGSVSSVALTMPSDFTVSGSPISSFGTLAVTGGVTKSGVQQEAYTYAADTGAANAYAVTLSPAPTLVAGSVVCFKAAHSNSGASTLNVNGGGAVAIKKNGNSTALASGDITAGQIIDATHDGTVWQISVPGTGGGAVSSLTTTGSSGAATLSAGVLNVPVYSSGAGSSVFVKTLVTRNPGTAYQNTSGFPMLVFVTIASGAAGNTVAVLTDSSNPPTTQVSAQVYANAWVGSLYFFVKNNDYYEVTASGLTSLSTVYEYAITSGTLTASGNLTGSRALATVYQNTGVSPVWVLAQVTTTGVELASGISDAAASPTQVIWSGSNPSTSGPNFVIFPVMPGHYYKVTCTGTPTLNFWNEYTLTTPTVMSDDLAAGTPIRAVGTTSSKNSFINFNLNATLGIVSGSNSLTSTLVCLAGPGVPPFAISGEYSANAGSTRSALFIIAPHEAACVSPDNGTLVLTHWREYSMG